MDADLANQTDNIGNSQVKGTVIKTNKGIYYILLSANKSICLPFSNVYSGSVTVWAVINWSQQYSVHSEYQYSIWRFVGFTHQNNGFFTANKGCFWGVRIASLETIKKKERSKVFLRNKMPLSAKEAMLITNGTTSGWRWVQSSVGIPVGRYLVSGWGI